MGKKTILQSGLKEEQNLTQKSMRMNADYFPLRVNEY